MLNNNALPLFPYINDLINSNKNLRGFYMYESHGAFSEKYEDPELPFASDEISFFEQKDFPSEQEGFARLVENLSNDLSEKLREAIRVLTTPESLQKACHRALSQLVKANIDFAGKEYLENCALNAYTFKDWTLARKLCGDDQLNWNSKTLYHLHVRKLSSGSVETATNEMDFDRELLTHLFNSTIKNCTPEEQNHIIDLRNTFQFYAQNGTINNHVGQVLAHKAMVVVETVIQVVAAIFNSLLFKEILRTGAFLALGVGAYKIVCLANDTAISYTLLDSNSSIFFTSLSALTICSRAGDIWWMTAMASNLNSFPALEKWVFKPLKKVTAQIYTFPSKAIEFAFRVGLASSEYAVEFIGNGADAFNKKLTDLRLGYETVEVRERWIESFLEERKVYRKNFNQVAY